MSSSIVFVSLQSWRNSTFDCSKNLSHHPIYVHTLHGKIKTFIWPWFMKCSSVHLTATLSILNRFQSFLQWRNRKKMYKRGHIFTCLVLKESVANDVIDVSLFVCCEPCHRRVEASSVGLSRRWRRTFWTLLMIAAPKITMSKWQHCKFDYGRWLFLFSFAVIVKEQRIITFLTEKCCYLSLRSKMRTHKVMW